MTAPLITLNATIAEIEDLLLTGKRVQDVARDLQEPPNNVYGVYCSLVEQGKIKDDRVSIPTRRDLTVATQTTGRPGSASPRPVPAPSPPPGPPVTGGGAEPSIDALVNAAARSASKRTQALGVKLAEVATVVRQRLREELDAAEKAQREKAVREAAAAEVARLEAELAEAKAKAGIKGRKTAQTRAGHSEGGKTTIARFAGRSPCDRCGRDISNVPAHRAVHAKSCKGAAS